MAIKYNTNTPHGVYDEQAKDTAEVLKKLLVFNVCRKCDKDSEMTFHRDRSLGNHSHTVDWDFYACCKDFEKEVYDKLEVVRPSKF